MVDVNKGYMNTHSSKSFQRIYKEFLDTILNKYCGPDKNVCVLGAYNDDLADQIEFKRLVLIDKMFGPLKYRHEKGHPEITSKIIHYLEQNFYTFFALNQAKYDVIIMSTVIEHLENQEKDFALNNIANHLNPKGVFILTYPNAYSSNRLLGSKLGLLGHEKALSERDREVGHKHMYTYNDLFTFKEQLGMDLIQKIGIMFKPLPHAMMTRYFSEDLDTFIELGYKLGPKACSYLGGVFQKNEL